MMTRATHRGTYKQMAAELRELAAAVKSEAEGQELIRLADQYDRLDQRAKRQPV